MASDDAALHWLQAAGRHPLLTPAEELHLGGLVRAWQDHPGGPDQAPPAVIRRGRRARDRMVSANLRLVARVAQNMGFRGRQSGDLADRLQAGAVGLTRAAEKFDPAKGYKFSTYSYWWIWQGIGNWNLTDSTIRLPLNVAANLQGQKNGDVSAEQLECALAASGIMSLDQPIQTGDGKGGCDYSLGDFQAAPAPPDHDPVVAELHARLAALPPLQAWLVRGYWGIGCAAQRIGALAAAEGISTHAAGVQLRLAEAALRGEPAAGRQVAPPPLNPWHLGECCQLSLTLPSPGPATTPAAHDLNAPLPPPALQGPAAAPAAA